MDVLYFYSHENLWLTIPEGLSKKGNEMTSEYKTTFVVVITHIFNGV